jgi:hypothetical protein
MSKITAAAAPIQPDPWDPATARATTRQAFIQASQMVRMGFMFEAAIEENTLSQDALKSITAMLDRNWNSLTRGARRAVSDLDDVFDFNSLNFQAVQGEAAFQKLMDVYEDMNKVRNSIFSSSEASAWFLAKDLPLGPHVDSTSGFNISFGGPGTARLKDKKVSYVGAGNLIFLGSKFVHLSPSAAHIYDASCSPLTDNEPIFVLGGR